MDDHHTVYTGNIESVGREAVALPRLASVSNGTGIIRLHGAFEDISRVGFEVAAIEARRDADVQRVVVSINSPLSILDVDDVLDRIENLVHHKPTFALIERCEGALLFAALHCSGVYATPAAIIGNVGSFMIEPWPEQSSITAFDVDLGIKSLLSATRPLTADSVWDRLIYGAMNGEQAEASDVVDFVVRTESHFLNRVSEARPC